jgi:hypothetical protein
MLTILRWFTFLPLAALLIIIAQTITDLIAQHLPWWISMSLVLFFGIFIALAGMLPVNVAPNGKVGAWIIVSLFVVIEIVGFLAVAPHYNVPRFLVHLYTDIAIIAGAFIAAQSPKPAS